VEQVIDESSVGRTLFRAKVGRIGCGLDPPDSQQAWPRSSKSQYHCRIGLRKE